MNTELWLALLAGVLLGHTLVQTVRLAKAREALWQSCIKDYRVDWNTHDSTEGLLVTQISEFALPRLFCYMPIRWVGNAGSDVDIKVNFLTNRVTYHWHDGTVKKDDINWYGSAILSQIDDVIRNKKSPSYMSGWD